MSEDDAPLPLLLPVLVEGDGSLLVVGLGSFLSGRLRLRLLLSFHGERRSDNAIALHQALSKSKALRLPAPNLGFNDGESTGQPSHVCLALALSHLSQLSRCHVEQHLHQIVQTHPPEELLATLLHQLPRPALIHLLGKTKNGGNALVKYLALLARLEVAPVDSHGGGEAAKV